MVVEVQLEGRIYEPYADIMPGWRGSEVRSDVQRYTK